MLAWLRHRHTKTIRLLIADTQLLSFDDLFFRRILISTGDPLFLHSDCFDDMVFMIHVVSTFTICRMSDFVSRITVTLNTERPERSEIEREVKGILEDLL